MTPLALVYRGPSSVDGCPEAAAGLLTAAGFRTAWIGPRDTWHTMLPTAAIYCQPGGGDVDSAWAELHGKAAYVRSFVSAGGVYIGFCLGGYLAGTYPGFALLHGEPDQWIKTEGATVTSDLDTTVEVSWRGQGRTVYFQDGPHFPCAGTVLATYPNGRNAAVVAPCGRGAVGVTGPHPEATADWYDAYSLDNPGATTDLGLDLIRTAMNTRAKR